VTTSSLRRRGSVVRETKPLSKVSSPSPFKERDIKEESKRGVMVTERESLQNMIIGSFRGTKSL